MDYNQWINNAKTKIKEVSNGEVFLLKDLFCGTDWEILKKGERIGLGKFFKNAVLDGKVESVIYIGKADNNSAKYQKIKEN